MASTSSFSGESSSKSSAPHGRSCCVGTYGEISCTNTQFTKDVSFFRFPDEKKESKRHKLWLQFVHRHRPTFKPSKYSTVCSVHFEDDCFTTSKEVAKEVGKRLRLKPDAVPTVDAANEPQEEQTLSRTARERVSVFAIMLC